MNLFEFEGKKLWQEYGLRIPASQYITAREIGSISLPTWPGYVIKAQTLRGKRADHGLIAFATTATEAQSSALAMLQRQAEFPELTGILIEEKIPHTVQLYLSISFSTVERCPVVLLSNAGGTNIEQRSDGIERIPIDPLIGLTKASIRSAAYRLALPAQAITSFIDVTQKLWSMWQATDSTLAEINPLVWHETELAWVALDAKVELDDEAAARQTSLHVAGRSSTHRLPTAAEVAAWQIDVGDHRGVAGSSYIDLDGDIAILASGGGASLACLDALVARGGKPANYTEYSGNPPREKVQKLTSIVLAKPNLRACWVVGATANFTDILETLSGFLDGVRGLPEKPRYPFIIRRAGPHDTEAFALLKEAAAKEGYDFRLFGADTPMISTAATVIAAANDFRP